MVGLFLPEKHGLTLLGKKLNDLLHLLLKANIKDSVRLVNNQTLQG